MGKYTEEAGRYSGKMSSLVDQLNDVARSLDSVNSFLGISSADASRDMLTYNVIISKEEIKNEITGVVFDVGSYSSTVASLAKTIDDPIGKLSKTHAKINPYINDRTPILADNIVTILNVFAICLADKTGKIINAVINNAPITFIPITTVREVKIEIIILISVVLIPIDLVNVSSNVIENILLYKIINKEITKIPIIMLIITSVLDTPNIEPYR